MRRHDRGEDRRPDRLHRLGTIPGGRVPSGRSARRNPATMNILGINAYHGDASAALVVDGQLVAAVEEERFTRAEARHQLPPPLDPLLPGSRRPATRGHRPLRALPEPEGEPRQAVRPRDQGPRGPPGRDPAGRQPPEDPEREANPRRRAGRPGRRSEGQAALRGAPPRAHRFLASTCRRSTGRRCSRSTGSATWSARCGASARADQLQDRRRGRIPPLARRLLHGRHAIPRVPEVRRRVQGDGPRLLRRTGVPGRVPADRAERRPRIRARPGLFPAPRRRRGHDVGRRLAELPPLWGPGMEMRPRTGPRRRAARGAPPEHRGLAAAAPRGGRAGDAPRAARPNQASTRSAWPAAWRSTASSTARSSTRRRSASVYIQPAAHDGGTSVGAALLRPPPPARRSARLRDGPRVLRPGVRPHAGCEPRSTAPASSTRSSTSGS